MHQYTGYIKVYKQWYNLFRLYRIVNLTYISEAAKKLCALQIYSNFVIIIIIIGQ
jgi:hypothetical protein